MVAVNAPALDHDQPARSLLPRLVLRLYRRRRPPHDSGMLVITIFGIFLTPLFYVLIRKFSSRRNSTSAKVA